MLDTSWQTMIEDPCRGVPAEGLRVAVVDEEMPYPPTSGKRIRTLELLQRLSGRHHITFLSHRNSDPAEARLAVEYLGDHGITPVLADRPPPPKSVLSGGPRFYAGLAANLFSPLPYVVSVNGSRSLAAVVAAHARSYAVDLWQCEWTPYADLLPRAPRLIMAHNIESLIWQRYHATEENWLKRWYIGRQWAKFERFERRVFGEATRVVAVSDCDARLARQRLGAPRVDVVDNGVDTERLRPTSAPRQPGRILFLGSLDWRPNLDGVRMLLDRIFPAVLREEPTARLCIVGRNPPAWLHRRAQTAPGVELVADAPDVRPFLADCGVMAVPLRIGGGSRLKILEALAAGLPVVSTRVGAEGLHLRDGEHLAIVEGIEDLASALVERIRHPEESGAAVEHGRRVVVEHYDWSILAAKLERIWAECALAQGVVRR